MNSFAQAVNRVLKTWLVRLCSDRGVGVTGVALLDAQIADLEKRCAGMQNRLNPRAYRIRSKGENEHTNGHSKQRPLFGST